MSEYLARIPSLERLYVSIQERASRDLEGRIAATFPSALVRRLPNRGRDVLPFLQWLEVAAEEGVELVCKVHTKRSPHVPEGDAWRRDMLDKLLGSEQVIREIVSSFRADPSLGMVGPAGHVVPSSFFWERNASQVEEICLRMGFDVRGVAFRYVAGSMFWARVDALLPLLRIALRNEDFEAEAGLVDGTLAHAIERCLPIAARIGGFGVTETEIPAGSVAKTLIDFAPLPPVTDRQS
jgi:lipopolysaccharide biosynthesis protein